MKKKLTISDVLKRAYVAKQVAEPDLSGPEISAGISTILAATEKLLAVNRGLTDPDERDSLEFRRVLTPAELFAERIDLDAGQVMRKSLRRLARAKTLKPLGSGHFDGYITGMITGNPLSTPLEEINPIHLVEQARRITQMGPGGLPSEDSISAEAQNVHPSQFGFLSPVEGPESSRAGVDTRMAWGAKIGSDGNLYQRFYNRRAGRHEWVSPSSLVNKAVALPD